MDANTHSRTVALDAESQAPEDPPGVLRSDNQAALGGPLRTRPEQIADRLVTAMALGEFVPGERLPTERELASALGASRITVREAIHSLEGDGYVEVKRGRFGGAFVKAAWGDLSASVVARTILPTWSSLEDVFDLRRAIEPLIARKAVDRHTQHDLDLIREAVEAYRIAPSREEMAAQDRAMHTYIAAATQNQSLVTLSLHLRSEVSLGLPAVPWSPSIREQAIYHHDLFVKAFEERNADDAARVAGNPRRSYGWSIPRSAGTHQRPRAKYG